MGLDGAQQSDPLSGLHGPCLGEPTWTGSVPSWPRHKASFRSESVLNSKIPADTTVVRKLSQIRMAIPPESTDGTRRRQSVYKLEMT